MMLLPRRTSLPALLISAFLATPTEAAGGTAFLAVPQPTMPVSNSSASDESVHHAAILESLKLLLKSKQGAKADDEDMHHPSPLRVLMLDPGAGTQSQVRALVDEAARHRRTGLRREARRRLGSEPRPPVRREARREPQQKRDKGHHFAAAQNASGFEGQLVGSCSSIHQTQKT